MVKPTIEPDEWKRKRMSTPGTVAEGSRRRKCRVCKAALTIAPTGRPRRYCSDRCRMAAYRRRGNRPVHFSSRSCEWETPLDLYAALAARFGGFDLDPAATSANAKCARYFTRAEDGLAQPWTGRVWLNPPYGREIGAWLKKAWESAQTTAELVVCLVPARTDTAWWHQWAARGEVEHLKGRLRFGGASSGAPFPSALVVFRNAAAVTKLAAVAG
jgi:phage N-6-adenine-methyltransferase